MRKLDEGIVDAGMVYAFLRRLTTPFEKWRAYEAGVIDADGKIILAKKDRVTLAQQRALGLFDTLVLNIKRLLGRLPGGSTRIGTYAAALWLLKERAAYEQPLLSEGEETRLIVGGLTRFKDWYLHESDVTRSVTGRDPNQGKKSFRQLRKDLLRPR